jgi:hypothetical protein
VSIIEPGSVTDLELFAKAIDRLAAAIEQAVLTVMDRPHASESDAEILPPFEDQPPLPPPPPQYQQTYQPQYAPPPAQQYQSPQGADPQRLPQYPCPQHGQSWKFVPAGISKSSGRPYTAFWGCSVRDCRERPR